MVEEGSDAAERVGAKLLSFYESLPADEQAIVDFILRNAGEHASAHADVEGYQASALGGPDTVPAGTQDAMKRVLFGAAGVTGGMATPGAIKWLVASARDANL